jgi:hypothetical protein
MRIISPDADEHEDNTDDEEWEDDGVMNDSDTLSFFEVMTA